MTVYKWRSGTRMRVSAQVAGEECARLEADGNLTPHALVDASRPDDAPLHNAFEWDNDTAAERWREQQARHIIGHLEVTCEQVKDPIRAFVSLTVSQDDGGGRLYYDTIRIARSDDAQAMLQMARRELGAFKRKYEGLKELVGVFAAIDALGAA